MNVSNNLGNNNVEEPSPVQVYVGKLFMYIKQETGFTKKSFTAAGLENHLKKTTKTYFQLRIHDDLLQSVIKIAHIFSQSINDKFEKAVEVFAMILHKIANFLAKHYLGLGLLMIAGIMKQPMLAFVIALFHVTLFVIEHVSFTWFLKLKDWILMFFNSDKVRMFFEDIFPNYGRALLSA